MKLGDIVEPVNPGCEGARWRVEEIDEMVFTGSLIRHSDFVLANPTSAMIPIGGTATFPRDSFRVVGEPEWEMVPDTREYLEVIASSECVEREMIHG